MLPVRYDDDDDDDDIYKGEKTCADTSCSLEVLSVMDDWN